MRLALCNCFNCTVICIFVLLYYRYLLDAKWFNKWKRYVGYDDWDTGFVGDRSANPGPIDNSFIIKGMILLD